MRLTTPLQWALMRRGAQRNFSANFTLNPDQINVCVAHVKDDKVRVITASFKLHDIESQPDWRETISQMIRLFRSQLKNPQPDQQ